MPQINNDFFELVPLPDEVAACGFDWQRLSGSADYRTRLYGRNFAPGRQGSLQVAQPWVLEVPLPSVPDGFLCSPEHGKMSFQPLKMI